MIFVKICGITNLEDAQHAVEAGADYLGFIFYPPSKRSITVETAKLVVTELRQQERCPVLVGVFVNETAVQMSSVLAEVGLDLAQLSGDEVPFLVGDPKSPIYGRSYKAIKPSSLEEAEAEAEWFTAPESQVMSDELRVPNPQSPIPNPQPPIPNPQSPTLLIDAYHPTMYGGTGVTSDWEIAKQLVQTNDRLMLAGGLTPENVGEAVRQIRPYAVDVASGVEAFPGKKDHMAVSQFIANAKGA